MVGDIRDKITSPFKTITTRNYSKPTHVNNVHGGGKKPRKHIILYDKVDEVIK